MNDNDCMDSKTNILISINITISISISISIDSNSRSSSNSCCSKSDSNSYTITTIVLVVAGVTVLVLVYYQWWPKTNLPTEWTLHFWPHHFQPYRERKRKVILVFWTNSKWRDAGERTDWVWQLIHCILSCSIRIMYSNVNEIFPFNRFKLSVTPGQDRVFNTLRSWTSTLWGYSTDMLHMKHLHTHNFHEV